MTEKSPTVTCRSVCERLVKYASPRDVFCRAESLPGIIKEARIALGQPDGDADLRNEIRLLRDGAKEMQKHLDAANESRDELRADVRSLTQQLDAANKRLDRAERSLRGAGWEDRGGEEWAPPIGPDPSPLLEQIAKANKRVSDLSDPAVADHVGALRREVSSLTHRLDESKRLASEWQKRAEEAEATVAQQNALLAKASTKDVTIELGKALQRAEEAELRCADWLLDRLVAALAGQRDGCDEELSRVRFLERSAV